MDQSLARLNRIARRFPMFACLQYEKIEVAASERGDLACQLDALYQRYFTLERLGKAASMMHEIKQGLARAEENSLAWQAGKLYEALGRLHFTRSEWRDALFYWKRCIDTSELTGDITSGIEGRIGLGAINNDIGNPNVSINYYIEANNLISQLDNPYLASKLALNIGVNYYRKDLLDQAEHEFERGLHFAKLGNVGEYVAEAYWHLGDLYAKQGRLTKANEYTAYGLQFAAKNGYIWLRGMAFETMGYILIQQGDLPAAIRLFEQAIEFAREIGSRQQQANFLEQRSNLAEQLGDLPLALSSLREYKKLKEQMVELSSQQIVKEISAYDQLERPAHEQLLELAANPELNNPAHSALQLILNQAKQILKLDWIGVWIYSEHEDVYLCHGQSEPPVKLGAELKQRYLPQYFQYLRQLHQQTVAVDTRLHPCSADLKVLFAGYTLRSTVELPLQLRGNKIGAICFAQHSEYNQWDRELVAHCSRIVQLVERDFGNIENQKIQLELHRNEKMASLGRLVAGIAHEINTPIGIGVTACSALHEEIDVMQLQLDTGKMGKQMLNNFLHVAAESIDVTERNLQRAAQLIRSFKEIAVDQNSDVMRKIHLPHYLDEIILSLSPILKRSPYILESYCEQDLEANTYPGALSQIVTNFVNNSILHGFENQPSGHMKVSLKSDYDGQILLEYSDNGCGMSEEIQRKIFDPFFTTKLGQGGSGLGMNIVYNLITQKLLGTIELKSAPGAGVHFQIRFPKAPPASV
ncbi:GAF domain-containing protein [Chitinibacter bivalviorum]|uniref:histidine kinase n=1 Tax=Chitinibacter bivalviorum TaxID=2739434 RepID=A0A7H9BJF8_9NEIS|nr:ATP-binding protein [Chitinibacter bivalviorum]QLG88436.1 GAF domain-containing protein [Chitinibacter bivalviorum]